MTTLVEIMVGIGVELSKEIGVIVELETMSGDFIPNKAIRGKIIRTLPQIVAEKFPYYDPRFDVAIITSYANSTDAIIFSLIDGTELFILNHEIIVFKHELYEIYIGQTPFFLEKQAKLAKVLDRARWGRHF